MRPPLIAAVFPHLNRRIFKGAERGENSPARMFVPPTSIPRTQRSPRIVGFFAATRARLVT
jgi:hypothetical protein